MLFIAYYQQYCLNWFNLTNHTQSWLSNLFLNLGSGLIGSVLVIVLYNRVKEISREREKKLRQSISLIELSSNLRSYNAFLMSLYAATAEKASSIITQNELNLLITFSRIYGQKYTEKYYEYFSEDLIPLYRQVKHQGLSYWDINPSVKYKDVIKGMKKCGQTTYANNLEKYLEKYKHQL